MVDERTKGKEVVIAVLRSKDGTKRVIKETFWTKLRRIFKCRK
jgi:hypothetical protein